MSLSTLPTKERLQEFDAFLDSKKGKAVLATSVATGVIVAASMPAKAEGVADVTAMITSLAAIAGAITAVVLGAMGVRYGIKLVNRVAVKG